MGRHFCPKIYVYEKLSKCPNFVICPKKNAIILHEHDCPKNIFHEFWEGARASPPPCPMAMGKGEGDEGSWNGRRLTKAGADDCCHYNRTGNVNLITYRLVFLFCFLNLKKT